MRFDIRGKIPTRSTVTSRLPSTETRLKYKIYTQLATAVLSLVTGATLFVAGFVLILMMAFAYEVMAVIGAAAMLTTGAALAGGSYLWLTAPA